LRRFVLLTLCGFLIFALTLTFVPLLPKWSDYAARAGFLSVFAALWLAAREGSGLAPWRPIFFAWFTAVFSLSLGYFFADPALALLGLTTTTPVGVSLAKVIQASLIVAGVLLLTRLSGQTLASLYLRKGRLMLGLGVGLIGALALAALASRQPSFMALDTAKRLSLLPWMLLFVTSNAFMEELLFRGLFLGRYEALIGKWPAILSTALAFTLAHMQVTYAPQMMVFLSALFVLAIAWGWLMHKTNSLWGSVLFHAGADLLIVLPIFAGFGAL
jgi:membrane protease YdiL (CAAX protease family)